MKNLSIRTLICSTALLVAFVISGAPTSAADDPDCMSIKQPDWISATARADGAEWVWTDRDWAKSYSYQLNRRVNGTWLRADGWGVMGKRDRYFYPWEKDGVRAEALSLQIVGDCYGTAWGVPKTVFAKDYIAPAPTPAPTVTATPTPTAQGSRKIECVNKKTSEVKTYALRKCPKGWRVF